MGVLQNPVLVLQKIIIIMTITITIIIIIPYIYMVLFSDGVSLSLQEGAVVALFKICRQDCFSCLYAHALRTVASICCVEEGIKQLEKVGRRGVSGGVSREGGASLERRLCRGCGCGCVCGGWGSIEVVCLQGVWLP